MIAEHREILAGPLQVSAAEQDGKRTLFLRGELDLANAETVEQVLQGALAESSCSRLVLDMSELEFIDSTGIAILVRALNNEAAPAKLRCVPSRFPAVTRVLELTGVAHRLRSP